MSEHTIRGPLLKPKDRIGRRFWIAKTQGVLAILKKEVERKVLKNRKKWAKRPKIASF